MSDGEPRQQPRKIRYEEGRINRHVEDRGGQREPRLLKSPEVAHGLSHPRVVAAFARKRSREFTDHECRGQTPEQRREQQDDDRPAVAGAVNDVFSAVGPARNHKEGGGNQRPERQVSGFLLRCGTAFGGICWRGLLYGFSRGQFLWSPPRRLGLSCSV